MVDVSTQGDEEVLEPWSFKTERALRIGLDEYCMFTDNIVIARYGHGGGGGYHNDKDVNLRIIRQNTEIDRLMSCLGGTFYMRLLDCYYRKGLNQHNQGWKVAAKLCGLMYGDRPRDYTNFCRWQSVAITYLFLAGAS